MPVCHVCDAIDDFHDEDGLYYCNVCNTQSQSMQVLEQEDTYASGRSGKSQSMLAVKVAPKSRKELNIELTKTKSWWSYEAYQLILQAQVDALIALGVSKHLNDIVRSIWFKYLELSGVAFCSTSKEQMQAYLQMAEERELEIKQRAEAKQQAKRRRLAETSTKEAVDGGREKLEGMDSGLETEENHNSEEADSDNDALSVKSYSSAKSAHSNASSRSRKSGCSDRNTIQVRKRRLSNNGPRIQIVTLRHLVCFSYIGLRYLKEPVIMYDLVRWIKMGLLPYFGTEDLLPQYMVASMGKSEQRQLINREVPVLLRFEQLWRSLTTFLSIKNLPPVDIEQLISRFVIDLNLPRKILILTNGILHQKNSRAHLNKKFLGKPTDHLCHEAEAVAVIMFALKLCFCLDDNFEHKQSNICRRIQQCCDTGSKYFVWDDWVLAQKVKCHEQQTNQVPSEPCCVFKLSSLRPFIDFEKNTYRKWMGRQSSYQLFTSNRMETRMEMKKPFLALSENQETDRTTFKPSTFVCLHPSLGSSLDTLVHDTAPYTKDTILSKDFSLTSITYTKPKLPSLAKNDHSAFIKSSGDSVISENVLPQEEEVFLPVSQGNFDIWKTQQCKENSLKDTSLLPSPLHCVPSTTDEEDIHSSQWKNKNDTKRTWSQIKTLDCCNQQEIKQADDKRNEKVNSETDDSNTYRRQSTNRKIDSKKKHTCKKLQKKLAKMYVNHSYVLYSKFNFHKSTSPQVKYFHDSYVWTLKYLSRLIGQKFVKVHFEVYRLEKALGYHKRKKNRKKNTDNETETKKS